jgi:hypothetical protein
MLIVILVASSFFAGLFKKGPKNYMLIVILVASSFFAELFFKKSSHC